MQRERVNLQIAAEPEKNLHNLNQWLDFPDRLIGPRGFPTLRQIIFVQRSPFNDITEDSWRQLALNNPWMPDRNLRANSL
jgi:hypothetical protein